jgi:Flp pilus assembly pilin Flp
VGAGVLRGEHLVKHVNQCVKVISEHLQGQTLSEYILILAAIAVAAMTAYTALGAAIAGGITTVTATL